MPAPLSKRHGRRLKRSKLCRSANLPNGCWWISHGIDQKGELPISKDVYLWKEDRNVCITKTLGDHASFKQKKIFHKQCLRFIGRNFGRKCCGAKKQSQAVAFKTGLQKHMPQPFARFQEERYSSGMKSNNTLQCSSYDFTNPFQSDANYSRENTVVQRANDVSLQHWLNSCCNLSELIVTGDLRGSRSTSLTCVTGNSLPGPHVYKLLDRQCLKKRNVLTSIENHQLPRQTVGEFWPHNSNYYPKFLDHRPLSHEIYPQVLVKECCSRGDRANVHRFNGFCQCNTPSVAKHATKPDSKKLVSERLRATLLALEDVKQPECGDLQDVLQLTKGGNNKSLSLIGDLDRKNLTNHSGTCQLSSKFSRDQGARKPISVKLKRKSKHVSRLNVQAKKKSQNIYTPMKSLACSKQHSLDTGASKKHAHSSNEKLNASRQTLNRCPKDSAFRLEEDVDHANSCSMGSNIRNLSQKYRPKVFQDLIGQGLVARALSNAVSKGKVAPVYLFQGPQGTGKTSAARIFAMALNCTTSKEKKPCGLCCECTAMISGNTSHVWEIDAPSYNGIDLMHELINKMGFSSSGLQYKIVIINECHLFSCQTWSALKKLFEEPPTNAIFILITTEPCKLPYCITSRCHRFHFFRIRHADIVNRLCQIAKLENIITEPGALSLIASKSDGSLRSAEIFLDQLSLLEQRITVASIHKLVGSVSHNELSRLLGLAFSSDIVRTVQKTKEIVELGVDPLDLLSQLATVITDIVAGSYVPMWGRTKEATSMHALSDAEMERLRTTLKVLWEAEERIRVVSVGRTTSLIETLLRLGPSLKEKSRSACLSRNFAKANSPALQCSERARSMKPKVCEKRRGVLRKRELEQMVSKGNKGRFQGTEGLTRSVLKGTHFGQGSVSDQSSYAEVNSSGYHTEVESFYAKADSSANYDYDDRRQQPSRLLSSSTKQVNPSAANRQIHAHMRSPCNIKSLWLIVLKHCRSLSFFHLLQKHAKLLAITFLSDSILAHVEIEKCAEKLTMEMNHVCVTNSFKKVLGPYAEVHFILASNLQWSGYTRCHAVTAALPFIQTTSAPAIPVRRFQKSSTVPRSSSSHLLNCRAKRASPLAKHFPMKCFTDFCSEDFGHSEN